MADDRTTEEKLRERAVPYATVDHILAIAFDRKLVDRIRYLVVGSEDEHEVLCAKLDGEFGDGTDARRIALWIVAAHLLDIAHETARGDWN